MATPSPIPLKSTRCRVTCTLQKENGFVPKKPADRRLIERWLENLFNFIGIFAGREESSISLLYRARVNGALGKKSLNIVGRDSSNPKGLVFKTQPGDNGTRVEMLVILPPFVSVNDDLVSRIKAALADDDLDLDYREPSTNIDEGFLDDNITSSTEPTTESITRNIELRLKALGTELRGLKLKRGDVDAKFTSGQYDLDAARKLSTKMPARLEREYHALIDKHLASVREEHQFALLELEEEQKRVRALEMECAKLENALEALRSINT